MSAASVSNPSDRLLAETLDAFVNDLDVIRSQVHALLSFSEEAAAEKHNA
jgi:hypothetical protein